MNKYIRNPLVSIIVPIYKVEQYLQRCLDSLVNQTYTNLEIILVDDGSPDSCPKICNEYAAKDKRIVVIHKENGGLSDARNAGLDAITGEFISFVDSDDYIEPNYVFFLLQKMLENPCDFVIADYQQSQESKETIHCRSEEEIIEGNNKIISTFCRDLYPVCSVAKLYKSSFIKRNNLRFEKGLLFEDQLWSCEMATKAQKICICKEKIYHYVVRNDSIMTSNSIKNNYRLESWSFILRKEIELLKPYQPHLQNDINYQRLFNITKILKMSIQHRMDFKKVHKTLIDIFSTKPIYYWYLFANSSLKKMFFSFLNLSPTITSQIVLYIYFSLLLKRRFS